VWFINPFSPLQIISWILLLCSLIFVINGFATLRKYGESTGKIENTTVLVKIGIYRYIRHPLYASLFVGGWGIFLKQPSYFSFFLGVCLSIFLNLTAKREEQENINKFGQEYLAYMHNTKMFIPYIY
jgi:protein-S-isoprenylcysteine O-methyltransferase Ste14